MIVLSDMKVSLPISQSLKIFTDMWNEGIRLHVLPSKDPLEGIEVDIKIAKILNLCLKNSFQEYNKCMPYEILTIYGTG